MRAWTTASDEPSGITLRDDVPDPVPLPDEVLIRVEAFAPNPGDIAGLAGRPPGAIPGWDGSGTVVRAAADRGGPSAGEQVIFLGATGGWAQLRAVPHATVSAGPSDLAPETLSTLPVPATSALRALRRLDSVLGRRVLIIGGTSAVGRFAVQLAHHAGARVVAVARDTTRHDELERLGAHETHATLASVTGRVHGALDLVGGPHLVEAYSLLEPDGTVIALGHAAAAAEHFPYGALVADHDTAGRSITSFFLGTEPDLAREMEYLATELQSGHLNTGPLDIRPWTELSQWISTGAERPAGRVVFRVPGIPG